MNYKRLETILRQTEELSIAVAGDFFLDEYLIIDPAKDEPSLETGLVAYQVVRKEASPGAAGTIAKNLAYMGIKNIYAVGYIGDDGRGLELSRGLKGLGVDTGYLLMAANRLTPTYTKPCINTNGSIKEINRLDIKNWSETGTDLENEVISRILDVQNKVDAIIIMDQVTERNFGVITDRVRAMLCDAAGHSNQVIMYADSRSRISEFHNVIIKGNQFEIVKSAMGSSADAEDMNNLKQCCEAISQKNDKPLVITLGERGALIASGGMLTHIPAFQVSGELDICGAGDAFTTCFVSALAAGANLEEAGIIGNLAASICITQVGSTGKVTPELLLRKVECYGNAGNNAAARAIGRELHYW